MKKILFVAGILIASAATAKLAPLSDEAAVKAVAAKEKKAYDGKVSAYQLCLSQGKVAAKFADKSRAVTPEPCVNPVAVVAVVPVVPVVAGTPANAGKK